jgi:hypothetical protein
MTQLRNATGQLFYEPPKYPGKNAESGVCDKLREHFDAIAEAQTVNELADSLSELAREARRQQRLTASTGNLIRIASSASWLRIDLLSCLRGISQIKFEIEQLRAITGGLQ